MNAIINNAKCLIIHNEMCKTAMAEGYEFLSGWIFSNSRFKTYYYNHLLVAILDMDTADIYDVSEIFFGPEDRFIGHYQACNFFNELTIDGHPPMIVYVPGF